MSEIEVAIIGGGAAGIAAGRRLVDAGVPCLILEARTRLGGRAWTETTSGYALDLGCGWLHSADRNPFVGIAEHQGRSFDKTPPPWTRPSMTNLIPLADQKAFQRALMEFFARVGPAVEKGDVVAATLLPDDPRWHGLLNAAATYISGAEFDKMSALDFERYDDTEVNWRVPEGYGAVVAAHGEGLPVEFDCVVSRIDHSGSRLRIETSRGEIDAGRIIVTLPTSVLAEREELFAPALAGKTAAAARLPLGLADKLFMSLDGADEFEIESRLFGRMDRAGTGNYHFRPFGRPMIEAYFGGELAHELEAAGEDAAFAFARDELVALLGADFARRIRPLRLHGWAADPFARGSYSYALPGAADERAVLAEPVDDRIYFAGEATSPHNFSTAHGAYESGLVAAEAIIAARKRQA